eukprot:179019-Prorocentrum_minimum.AAC.1
MDPLLLRTKKGLAFGCCEQRKDSLSAVANKERIYFRLCSVANRFVRVGRDSRCSVGLLRRLSRAGPGGTEIEAGAGGGDVEPAAHFGVGRAHQLSGSRGAGGAGSIHHFLP